MNFKVLSDSGADKMYEGQVITYKVHPIAGIPLFWMTEINHVKDKERFVDHQLAGPYKIWHHEHRFKSIPGGVEMTDIVHYMLPMGWIGRIAHSLFVRRQVEKIFEFRYEKLEQKFGKL